MLSDKVKKYINPFIYNEKYENKKSLDLLIKSIEMNEISTLCLDSTFDYLKDRFMYILDNDIEGDVFLAGVWKGGLAVYLQALIIENGRQDSIKLILSDTFGGFLESNREKEKSFLEKIDKIPPPTSDDVKYLFIEFGLPLSNVLFLEGDIASTSNNFDGKISLLILDMDFYNPTFQALINLYDSVDSNGIIYIDDYCCEDFDCKEAVDKFLNIKREGQLVRINRFGVSLIRSNYNSDDFPLRLNELIFSIYLTDVYSAMDKLNKLNTRLQSINCIGIDYNKDFCPIGIKFYFGYFEKLDICSSKEIDFIPDFDLLNRLLFIQKKDSNNKNPFQNDGLSFSVKWNFGDEKPRYGFHIRMKNFVETEFWKTPEKITLSEIDLKNYQGIGVEYIDSKPYIKNYYYISDEITKGQLAILFNDDRILKAKIVEYTESELGVKVILWYNLLNSDELIKSDVNCFADRFLINEVGLKESFHGFYLNQEKISKYYASDISLNKIDTYCEILDYYKL